MEENHEKEEISSSPKSSWVRRLVIWSRRNHWMLYGPLGIAQLSLGMKAAQESRLQTRADDTIAILHSLSGLALFGSSLYFFWVKYYLVTHKVPRVKLWPPVVDRSIRYHVYIFGPLSFLQLSSKVLGGGEQLHRISGYCYGIYTAILILEKFYISQFYLPTGMLHKPYVYMKKFFEDHFPWFMYLVNHI